MRATTFSASVRLALGLLCLAVVTTLRADDPTDPSPAPKSRRDAENLYRVAAGHYTHQRWEKAAEEFQRMAERFPEHPLAASVAFFRGESLHQLKQYDNAYGLYQAYTAGQHTTYRYLADFRLGECSALMGKHRRALAELDAFVARHPAAPNQGHAQLYRGQCMLALQQPQGAREAYLKSLDLLLAEKAGVDLLHKCRFGLAQSLQSLGELDQATRFYRFIAADEGPMADDASLEILRNRQQRQPSGDSNELVAGAESFLKRFPASSHCGAVELILAKARRRNGQHREAAVRLVAFVQRWEQQPPKDMTAGAVDATLAECQFEAGRAFHAAGDSMDAMEQFDACARRTSHGGLADDALYCRVLIAPDEQLAALCEQFESQFPQSEHLATVLEIHGESLVQSQDFAKAAAILQKCVPSAHVQYLTILSHVGAEQYAHALAAAKGLDWTRFEPSQHAGLASAVATALTKRKRSMEASDVLSRCLLRLENCVRESAHDEALERLASHCAAQRAVLLAELNQIEEAMEMIDAIRDPAVAVKAARFAASQALAVDGFAEALVLYELIRQQGQCRPSDLRSAVVAAIQLAEWSETLDPIDKWWARLRDAEPTHAASFVVRYGKLLEEHSELQQALTLYRWAAGMKGSNQAASAFHAGRLLEQQGDLDAAAALLQASIHDSASAAASEAAKYHLAWVRRSQGDGKAAHALFVELAEDAKNDAVRRDAVFRAASWMLRSGDAALATDAVGRLTAELKRNDDGETAATLAPLLLLRGHASAMQGNWPEAESWFVRAASDTAAEASLRADASFLAGESMFRQRKMKPAQTWLHRAVKLAPNGKWRPALELRQAQILATQKQWRQAQRLAESVRTAWPEFNRQFEVVYLIGRCHAARAQFRAARDAYEDVLAMPAAVGTVTAAKAQWMIGETHLHQKAYSEAIRAYHRVELLHDYKSWQALALLQAAKCHKLMGQLDKAEAMLTDVCQRFPHTRAAAEARRETRVEAAADRSNNSKTSQLRRRRQEIAAVWQGAIG